MNQQPQDRLLEAKQYAEAARQRNDPGCQCEQCKRNELLPGVMQLLERWKQ